MYDILAFGYEFLTEFLPFLFVLTMFQKKREASGQLCTKIYWILPVLFALYIAAVFYVTGAGTVYEAMRSGFRGMTERVNLIPFSREINEVGYVLNVVMFVPFGFLVPLLWKELGKFRYSIISGFCFSLLIELSQLLSWRGTDVDDLILNTLGAAVGFGIYKVWDRISGSRYQLDCLAAMELPAYVLAMYLGRCLLCNQLGLINLVYGF